MMTVRYPNGTAVQYNTAGSLYYKKWGWELYTESEESGGSWIASIQLSAGAIVEFSPACKVFNAADQKAFLGLMTEIKFLRKKLDKLTAEKRKKTWKRIRKDKII